MPRPSKQALANRKRARDATSGRIISSNDSRDNISSTSYSTASNNIIISEYFSLNETEEDWQLWESYTESQLAKTSFPLLVDDGSSSKRPRNGHYNKNSTTTEWRRRVEASKIKDNEKLTHFGFKIVSKNICQEQQHIAHTKRELTQIRLFYNNLYKFIQPEMNKRQENSEVNAYSFSRYSAVKYYFEKRLEGFNKGDASKAAAKFHWENASQFYRPNAIVCWCRI